MLISPGRRRIEDAEIANARGDVHTACAICHAILASRPQDVAALAILAVATLRAGDTTAALEHADRAISILPGNFTLHSTRGVILRASGRPADAVHAYDRAFALGATDAATHSNKGNALGDLGRFEEALESHGEALRRGGSSAERLTNRAIVLQALGRSHAALADADHALALDPGHAPAHDLRGTVLQDLGQPRAAFEAFEAAIAAAPAEAAAFYHRGNLLQDIGALDLALADYVAALRRAAHHVPARINRANLLADLGRFDEAEQAYAALAAIPGQSDAAAWNRSLSLLKRGAFEAGWQLYESRWQAPGFQSFRLMTSMPRWTPERRAGTVLAWGEQGVGDEIMFASMLPDLSDTGCDVVAAVDPRLVPLFARSFPGIRTVARDDADQERFDTHLPFGSLGTHFRTSRANFPRRPFLVCDPARAIALRACIGAVDRPAVGISWASARVPTKSFAAARLATVPALGGARLVNLQYGNCAAELDRLREAGADVVAKCGVDTTDDIDGLAALVAACDIVVTISNVTAHLAGALGKRTFLLLPFAADWRWGFDRSDSLWYGTLTILRQIAPGDWDSVFALLDTALRREWRSRSGGRPFLTSRPAMEIA
ncbi:tetratricopeptide repeat protein [Hyphomonas sp.]|uniref:tetratricopeptide repeat protein n=1 Tax=Hyphomonas sp. TaxID=87 RepID=UPI0037C0F594